MKSWEKRWKQAGAELGQAQVKLDAIIEVIVEVGVEVVKFNYYSGLVGGWMGGRSDKLNLTQLKSSWCWS